MKCKHCGKSPHEVRTTGVAWYREYIEELEAEIERLREIETAAAKVASEHERLCGNYLRKYPGQWRDPHIRRLCSLFWWKELSADQRDSDDEPSAEGSE